MQSDDFMTNKILPWGDILGNPNGCDTPFEKSILYPFAIVVGIPADLVDLEPLCVSLVELVARHGSTRSHICQHGSDVVRPLRSISNERMIISAFKHTFVSLAVLQSKLTVSPGFASATRAAGPEPKPHVVAGLVAPLIGSCELTWRMGLLVVGGLPARLPSKTWPWIEERITRPWANT